MNKLLRLSIVFSIILMVFGGTAAVSAASASTTGQKTPSCVATGNGAGFHINANGTAITVLFRVKGVAGCKPTPVTLVTWSTPNITGTPLSKQKLFDFSSGVFSPQGAKGLKANSLTAKLPGCTYQVDLVAGSSPLGINNTDNYGIHRLAGMLGGHACITPTVPPVTSTVTPTTPPVGNTTAAQTTALPNTGSGNIIGLFVGSVTVAGLTHYFIRGRKMYHASSIR